MQKLALALFVAISTAGAGLAFPAVAQDAEGAATQRQAMMSQVGATTRLLAGMVRGEAPYNAEAAATGMRLYRAVAAGYGYLFPEGSESAAETEAAPAIWEDRAGFLEAVAKFEADAAAGIEPAGQGLDAFRAAFGTVAANCQACHEGYRISRN